MKRAHRQREWPCFISSPLIMLLWRRIFTIRSWRIGRRLSLALRCRSEKRIKKTILKDSRGIDWFCDSKVETRPRGNLPNFRNANHRLPNAVDWQLPAYFQCWCNSLKQDLGYSLLVCKAIPTINLNRKSNRIMANYGLEWFMETTIRYVI